MSRIVLAMVGIFVGAILALYFIKVSIKPPDNSHVIMDSLRGSYASIPCVLNNWLDQELITNRRLNPHDPSMPLILQPHAWRSTLGSVTHRLLHVAHCPVLIIPSTPAHT